MIKIMNISLTVELEKFVQEKVNICMYNSASEVIREGLRLLKEQDMFRQMKLQELAAKERMSLWEEDQLLPSLLLEQILDEEKSSLEEDDSLERIIELVDEWISDESGYDETVLPEIKAGLDQNRLVENG